MIKKFLKKVFSAETQLKIEKFFVEQLWQLCLVTAFIFFCAWIFNKYMERDRDYGERDYEYDRDYGDVRRVGNFEYDTYYGYGRDYASGEYKLSSRELKEWARDLLDEVKPEHRQSFEKENFERKAREMGIEPREYSMEELYLVTLMMETDHDKTLTKYGINNIDTAICLARDWLEDDDVDMRYGEKLGAYYFNVVCVE